ncbi:SHOCT domain-containing protein [Clostridium sp.]
MEQQNITDEIVKYKELLDEGIITKKEFTIKKNC